MEGGVVGVRLLWGVLMSRQHQWWGSAVLVLSLLAGCAGTGEHDTVTSTSVSVGVSPSTSTSAAVGQLATITIATSSDWASVELVRPHLWHQVGEATVAGAAEWQISGNVMNVVQPITDAEAGKVVEVSVPLEIVGIDTDPGFVIKLSRGDLGAAPITLDVGGVVHEFPDPGGRMARPIRHVVDTGSEAVVANPGPDWIFLNGTVITVAGGRAEAIAVADERIIAVGSESEILGLAGSSTETVDLGGRALLPGFIDAHSHGFSNDGGDVQDLILRGGVTTVTEMTTTPDTLELLYELDAHDELRVRVSAYLEHTSACGDVRDRWWKDHLDHAAERVSTEMLELVGVKIFTDGGVCNGIARSFPVAAGLPNGPLYFDSATLLSTVGQLDEAGYSVGIHALGDLAVRQVLDVYEAVIDDGNPLRHRLEHNALVHPDDRGRYDSAGMVAVIFGAFPTCAILDGLANGEGTPAEYLDYEWPYPELLERNPGTTFAWHVDYPYFFDWDAPTHLVGFTTKAEMRSDGTWCEPPPGMQAGIDVEEAIEIMTMGSAFAIGREAEIGSIEAGKYADLVILSGDPTTLDRSVLAAMEVELTMVGGVAEYCSGDFADLCSR